MDDLDDERLCCCCCCCCCFNSLKVSLSFLFFAQSSKVFKGLSGLGGTIGFNVVAIVVVVVVVVVDAVIVVGKKPEGALRPYTKIKMKMNFSFLIVEILSSRRHTKSRATKSLFFIFFFIFFFHFLEKLNMLYCRF